MNDTKTYHNNGSVKYHWSDTFYKEYRYNGSLKIEVPLKDRRYHGLWKTYGSSGELISTRNFVDGQIEGDVCNYYNGKLKSQVYLKGHLYTNGLSYANSIKHGESKTWNNKGILLTQCNFFNNVLHGEYKRWNDYGELIETKMFNYGEEILPLEDIEKE